MTDLTRRAFLVGAAALPVAAAIGPVVADEAPIAAPLLDYAEGYFTTIYGGAETHGAYSRIGSMVTWVIRQIDPLGASSFSGTFNLDNGVPLGVHPGAVYDVVTATEAST